MEKSGEQGQTTCSQKLSGIINFYACLHLSFKNSLKFHLIFSNQVYGCPLSHQCSAKGETILCDLSVFRRAFITFRIQFPL